MVTIQAYECPVHGRFELTVTGEVPDTIACPKVDGGLPPGCRWCNQTAEWRPSAPAVHWPGTALKSLARESNPW